MRQRPAQPTPAPAPVIHDPIGAGCNIKVLKVTTKTTKLGSSPIEKKSEDEKVLWLAYNRDFQWKQFRVRIAERDGTEDASLDESSLASDDGKDNLEDCTLYGAVLPSSDLEDYSSWERVNELRHIQLENLLEIGRAVQQECRDRSRMPSSA
eukprot:TRINITY_DN14085_c0_g1_i7.p1 TRINITY_DN14085_c0_g1~~TRINITY_DN14085_c0_g1_i7.p1  ORF type:complete len:152 (-),score=15.96 TRINITY_DN14085_c0_g1_i7:11-466(-)